MDVVAVVEAVVEEVVEDVGGEEDDVVFFVCVQILNFV